MHNLKKLSWPLMISRYHLSELRRVELFSTPSDGPLIVAYVTHAIVTHALLPFPSRLPLRKTFRVARRTRGRARAAHPRYSCRIARLDILQTMALVS
jgi:hypothetical protein